MHPYRDKEDLADIRENIETIRDDLTSLNEEVKKFKPQKHTAIGEAISYKVSRFDLADFLFTSVCFVVVVAALGGLGYLSYKWGTSDSSVVVCEFDYRTIDHEDGINVTGVRDWQPDSVWGPFDTLEDAKVFAKENGCPEVK